MNKKVITSVTAVALAALAVTSPTLANFPKLDNNAITASAASKGRCKFIKTADNNYTMTLDGEITKEFITGEFDYYNSTVKDSKDKITQKNITRIVAMPGTVLPENSSYLFDHYSYAVTIDLSVADTSNVKNMHSMFDCCFRLKNLYMDNFNTVNVSDMGYMFRECTSLTSLDLRSFDTRNVTTMMCMFDDCKNLKTIYASSNFSTAKVNSSSYMFSACSSLVGGKGTKYDYKFTDATYARIDKAGQPGYFTA